MNAAAPERASTAICRRCGYGYHSNHWRRPSCCGNRQHRCRPRRRSGCRQAKRWFWGFVEWPWKHRDRWPSARGHRLSLGSTSRSLQTILGSKESSRTAWHDCRPAGRIGRVASPSTDHHGGHAARRGHNRWRGCRHGERRAGPTCRCEHGRRVISSFSRCIFRAEFILCVMYRATAEPASYSTSPRTTNITAVKKTSET